ncbi:hypothetical protein ACQJBY_015255 [Aegilops geniculata]
MPKQILQFSELVLKYAARLGYSVWSLNESYNIAFVAAWVPVLYYRCLVFGHIFLREMGTDKFREMGTDKFSEGWLRVNYCDQVGNKCFLLTLLVLETGVSSGSDPLKNKNLAEAIHMQMEVQTQLHEQL